ncbi:MAG: hypothetical protein KDD89_15935 [Anaerolineales bacterium]|nr:hypothetical protein [Anaerolineales bacterium]
MLDSLTFLSAVSLAAGTVALVATFASVVVAGWLSIQQRPLNQVAHITFGLTQLALMAQMMTAVLLLALDMTQLQSLVYYLAGFTAVAGFMLFYWWPTTVNDHDHVNRKTRRAMVAAVAAFLLAVTGLTIGADVAYAGQESTAVVPLQIKEFSATTWTARPEQTVLCLGCNTAEEMAVTAELEQLEAFSQAELVRFTGQTSTGRLNTAVPTSGLEEENDDSAQLIQPVYTLIAFMRLNQ